MVLDLGRIKHRGDLMHKSIGSNGLAIPSNWRLSADGLTNVVWTPESAAGGSVSYGSNANDVGLTSAAGASTLVSRADHVHRGVRTITSNGSNSLFGDVNLVAGTGIALGVAGQGITILNTGGSGGGGSVSLSNATPLVESGSGSAGTGTAASRDDHVHPADGGGGGGSALTLPLDVRPGTDHAKDDNWDDSSSQSGPSNGLDAKWTNPLSSGANLNLTIALYDHYLSVQPATAGAASTGKRMMGIRQAAPTGSFTVMAKIRMDYQAGNTDTAFGPYVARTASTLMHTAGKYHQNGGIDVRVIASATYSETADTGGFDGFNSDTTPQQRQDWRWYKIVWDSGTSVLSFYWSNDGTEWNLKTTRSSMSQPDRIGLCFYSNSATIFADMIAVCEWFRVTEP